MKRLLFAAVLAAFVLLSAPVRAQHAILLELFTSEGCSSCPPADALLRQLANTHTRDGDLVVALSEHVTYWNSLGWRDPFSTDTSTARQQAYSRRFGESEVYTPQAVVNGEAQVLGSDPAAITQAFNRSRKRDAANPLHIVSAMKTGNTVTLTYTFSGAAAGRLDLFAAIAEDSVSSVVPRGENGGRTLTHVAVATQLTRLPARDSHATASPDSAGSASVQIPLPRYPGTGTAPSRHLVLFAQLPNLGAVVAVDTTPL